MGREWSEFQIQIPGIDILEPVRALLEILLIFLEIAKTILETIKVFLFDFGNPLKLALEALIKILMMFIEALNQTGLFMYTDTPDPRSDPEFRRSGGGADGFALRWKGSLMDAKDNNRPKPLAGAMTGGFVILAVEHEELEESWPSSRISWLSSIKATWFLT